MKDVEVGKKTSTVSSKHHFSLKFKSGPDKLHPPPQLCLVQRICDRQLNGAAECISLFRPRDHRENSLISKIEHTRELNS